MKKYLTLACLFFLCACGGSATQVATPVLEPSVTTQVSNPIWELVWQDEFDGSTLDHSKWQEETGGDGWGNHELQFYTSRTENLRLAEGKLIIEARKENYSGREYTSARIKTAGLQETTYGRFEARIKIPAGQGTWPAFWMLGNNISTAGWPNCGEIDIMENIGKEPATIHGTVHGPGYSGAQGNGRPYSLASGKFADEYHIYAVEWEATEIRWYVDGIQYHSVRPDQLAGKWVFDHPHFLILNLAIGGDWPGTPDASTVFPQQMLVDYVRVFKRKS
ncbi:MAG: glycoside hydrolase family 16 protein [Burkholderiales bacterium]|nr:glycoside hydrolase family 16 protein [Burkholderiales bacterium]MBI3727157.1 glycoside hydrolase family 16 protein [Burkholderiales bacterium]